MCHYFYYLEFNFQRFYESKLQGILYDNKLPLRRNVDAIGQNLFSYLKIHRVLW